MAAGCVSGGENFVMLVCVVWTQLAYQHVADRETDRLTDNSTMVIQ